MASRIARRLLFLALIVAAVSAGFLVAMPGKAEAQQTNLEVTYNWANGKFDFTWVDDSNYSGTVGTLERRCQADAAPSAGHWIYYGTSPDPVSTGTATRISSNCNARSVLNKTLNLQPGTTYYFDLRTRNQFRRTSDTPQQWQDDWNDLDTEVTLTIPNVSAIRVAISAASYSPSSNTISVSWTAPTGIPPETDWWLLGTRDNDVQDTDHTDSASRPIAVLLAEDSPNARSATIALRELATTITVPPSGESTTYLWLVASLDSSNPPDEDDYSNGTTAGFSVSYALDWSLQDCDDSYFQALGNLSGYSHDITGGDLAAPICRVHYEDSSGTTVVGAETFRFRLSDTRDVTLTLTVPSAFPRTTEGRYKVRIRSQGSNGTIVASEETGQANQLEIELDAFIASSGFDYFLEVMRQGYGGGYDWSMNLAYGFIQPPTPTPEPTATPRAQPNLDFRLYPNPGSQSYAQGEVYRFSFEGDAARLPVQVRVGNSSALALGGSGSVSCSGNPASDDVLTLRSLSSPVHMRTCEGNANSSIEVLGGNDEQLAIYMVFIAGTAAAAAVPEPVPLDWGEDVSGRDLIGLTIVIASVCQGVGSGCDAPLIKNAFVFIVAVGAACIPLLGGRRRDSSLTTGVAIGLFIVVLMLGWLVAGFPLWILGVVILVVFALGALSFVRKMGEVKA